MQLVRNVALGALVACLGACASTPSTTSLVGEKVRPYRIDVVQGNVVTKEQLAVVQVGMPQQTVQDILGSPLLVSAFRTNRWDYVFTFDRLGSPRQSRHITIWFDSDRVARIEADELPSEKEFVASIKSIDIKQPLPPLTAPDATGQTDKARDTKPVSVAAQPATGGNTSQPATASPATPYPPLEATP